MPFNPIKVILKSIILISKPIKTGAVVNPKQLLGEPVKLRKSVILAKLG